MSANIEEFVNPKSMMTPGIAAAVVATIAGALFSMFGIALPAALIILSFFVGAMVFHSKEFSDPAMKGWVKTFFYVLNSLIIFSMATGTHSVLDKGKRTASSSNATSFVSTVYAQESQQKPLFLKQERPLFYDWTKPTVVSDQPSGDQNVVKFSAKKDYGMLKNWFVNAGLATPDYKVQIKIDESKFPAGVKSVTWRLPSAYFAKSSVTVTDATKDFAVSVDAWKPFPISADVELKSGERVRVGNFVDFARKEK